MPKKNAAKASAEEGEPPSASRGKRAKAADTAPVDDGATSPSPKAKKRKSEGDAISRICYAACFSTLTSKTVLILDKEYQL